VFRWDWVLEPKSDLAKGFLEQLVQYSGSRDLTWKVVLDQQKSRFLLRSIKSCGIDDSNTARHLAFAHLDAIKGMADVLDVGRMEITLGNSIKVPIDG
jgi:hypothetical protein